jgi:hypothetical protein
MDVAPLEYTARPGAYDLPKYFPSVYKSAQSVRGNEGRVCNRRFSAANQLHRKSEVAAQAAYERPPFAERRRYHWRYFCIRRSCWRRQ